MTNDVTTTTSLSPWTYSSSLRLAYSPRCLLLSSFPSLLTLIALIYLHCFNSITTIQVVLLFDRQQLCLWATASSASVAIRTHVWATLFLLLTLPLTLVIIIIIIIQRRQLLLLLSPRLAATIPSLLPPLPLKQCCKFPRGRPISSSSTTRGTVLHCGLPPPPPPAPSSAATATRAAVAAATLAVSNKWQWPADL